MRSARRCGSAPPRAPRPASSRPEKRTLQSSRLVPGPGLLDRSGSFLARGLLLCPYGRFGVHPRVDGELAELPGKLQAIVGLRLELLGVVDAVHRADLDAQGAVHAARVVDHEPDRVRLRLARAVGVALDLLYGDAVVGTDPHALQTGDAAVHVHGQHAAAALRQLSLVLGVLARDLLPKEVLQGHPHPLQDALSDLWHIRNLS